MSYKNFGNLPAYLLSAQIKLRDGISACELVQKGNSWRISSFSRCLMNALN